MPMAHTSYLEARDVVEKASVPSGCSLLTIPKLLPGMLPLSLPSATRMCDGRLAASVLCLEYIL